MLQHPITQTLLVFSLMLCASKSFAQPPQGGLLPHVGNETIVTEDEVAPYQCYTDKQLFRGFLFRRYAGSVEMETKTLYPKGYHGRFTYLPWRPDWVNTPGNEYRRMSYPHHRLDQDCENCPIDSNWNPKYFQMMNPFEQPHATETPANPQLLEEMDLIPELPGPMPESVTEPDTEAETAAVPKSLNDRLQ